MDFIRKPLVVLTLALHLNAAAAKSSTMLGSIVNRPVQMLPRVTAPAFVPSRISHPAFPPGRPATHVAGAYKTSSVGEPGTLDFRVKFSDDSGKSISPWHDIPLQVKDGVFNAIFEIPKMTKPKMEVATKEEGNPIAQDEKKGKLRDYHGPIFWNYGMFPQTWEDPTVEDPQTKCSGDNDPLDVVEVGSAVLPQGSVSAVKPLGALAMIDEGELDWKVIAISVDDPMAATMNDIGDVPPEVISGIREWFRWYKTPDGKPLNAFGFDEKPLDKAQTLKVIEETHEAWKKLMSGETDAGKLWKPAQTLEASVQTTSDVTSISTMALIGVLLGAFAVLRFRRSSSTLMEEPLIGA